MLKRFGRMGSYIYAHSSEESMSEVDESDNQVYSDNDSATNKDNDIDNVNEKDNDIDNVNEKEDEIVDIELREYLMRSFPGIYSIHT